MSSTSPPHRAVPAFYVRFGGEAFPALRGALKAGLIEGIAMMRHVCLPRLVKGGGQIASLARSCKPHTQRLVSRSLPLERSRLGHQASCREGPTADRQDRRRDGA